MALIPSLGFAAWHDVACVARYDEATAQPGIESSKEGFE